MGVVDSITPTDYVHEQYNLPRPTIYSKSFYEVVGSAPESLGVSPLTVASSQRPGACTFALPSGASRSVRNTVLQHDLMPA